VFRKDVELAGLLEGCLRPGGQFILLVQPISSRISDVDKMKDKERYLIPLGDVESCPDAARATTCATNPGQLITKHLRGLLMLIR